MLYAVASIHQVADKEGSRKFAPGFGKWHHAHRWKGAEDPLMGFFKQLRKEEELYMSEENKALVRRAWAAPDNPNIIDEVYAPDLVWLDDTRYSPGRDRGVWPSHRQADGA